MIPAGRIAQQDVPWSARLRVLATWVAALLLATAALAMPLPFSGQVALQVGDVAPADVLAPRQATFVSEIQTEKLRDVAAVAVPDVYDPPQARIARQQLTLATQVLNFVSSVRGDSFADQSTKAGYLGSINAFELPAGFADRILALPPSEWDTVMSEVQVVLGQSMRDVIRENDVAAARSRVPTRVRLDLSDEDAAIVSQFVQSLLAPNSFYNQAKTEERRQQARDRVEPATVTVERGEAILRSGDIVSAEDVEALNALGLRQASFSWQDVESTGAVIFVLGMVFLYYLWRQEPRFWLSRSQPLLLSTVLVVFIVIAKALIPAHAVLPYVFPYAALTMLLAVLMNLRIALIASVFFVLLVGWLATGSTELMAYAFCGAIVGTLKLRRGDHLARYAIAGIFTIALNLVVVLAFRLVAGRLDLRGLAELSLAGVTNGILTVAIALLGSYLLGMVFGVITPLQLMELSRPTQPLLRLLLLKAPGTYHHTLIVSNMAERAADAIGADGQLARVGAYYHDVGKANRPYFFAENRAEDQDPHARLDPYTSAQIILNHVHDGLDLARKYRLPSRVAEFIPEHHGTTVASFFYHAAVKQAGTTEAVDKAQFTYPGPRPRSRETAVTMLADCSEATVRARRPASADELTSIVEECIGSRVAQGQLDQSGLTLGDLQAIQRAFIDVLRGIHHPRITYPQDARAATQAPEPQTAKPLENAEVVHGPAEPSQDATPDPA